MTKQEAIIKATQESYRTGASVRFGLNGEVFTILFKKVTSAYTLQNGVYAKDDALKGTTQSLRARPIMEPEVEEK